MRVPEWIWSAVGALLMVAAGAYLAIAHSSLQTFRPGAPLGLYYLFVGDILIFALVASYRGSLPPRPR